MTRKRIRRTPAARKTRPVEPSIKDPGSVGPADSEDEAGTYAPLRSRDDSGESDDGVIAQGPPAERAAAPRARRRKEAIR